ncbi:MAG TPA: hypothetical protein VGI58_08335 [Streptosporangiaceae bacterium]|jgi:hypothetical protein
MADLETISALATGAGTLVLAVATFGSVRSANRSSRLAEEALQVNMRPLLMPSRQGDATQKIFFFDGQHVRLEGGRGDVIFENGVVYLAMSLRNAGQGIAVLHGWRFQTGQEAEPQRPDPASFHPHSRDIMIAPGDIGFWQGAFRDPADPQFEEAVTAAKSTDIELITIDLLYGDHEGGQRTISRMSLRRVGEARDIWLVAVGRYWNLDRPDPR